jgi:hypothetical protein
MWACKAYMVVQVSMVTKAPAVNRQPSRSIKGLPIQDGCLSVPRPAISLLYIRRRHQLVNGGYNQ